MLYTSLVYTLSYPDPNVTNRNWLFESRFGIFRGVIGILHHAIHEEG